MLTKHRLTRHSKDYHEIIELFDRSFPKKERIPISYLISNENGNDFEACYEDGVLCGFYSALTFGTIAHILFLAVEENARDKGYGSEILQLFEQNHIGCRIIVDIERVEEDKPNYDQRVRRLAFYQKNGYTYSGISYTWHTEDYDIYVKGGSITQEEFDAFWFNLDERRRKKMN